MDEKLPSVPVSSVDRNVKEVQELLQSRMEVGFKKYGTTTERTDLTLGDWLQHLQEELLDAAVYIQKLKGITDANQRISSLES